MVSAMQSDVTTINYILKHQCMLTLTLCSPFSKRDNISESLLSECTLYTVQQRCCSRPIMYSFSICSCILNSLKVAQSDWRNERKSLLLEKLVFDNCGRKKNERKRVFISQVCSHWEPCHKHAHKHVWWHHCITITRIRDPTQVLRHDTV